MGLNPVSLAYVDTNVFIQAFESQLGIAEPARALLRRLQEHPGAAITSELTLAELLAPVKAAGALTLAEKTTLYDAVLDSGFIALVPVTRSLLIATAALRLSFPQKLPDAIHVVTAVDAGCRYLVSSDRDTKRLPPSISRLVPDASGLAILAEALRD